MKKLNLHALFVFHAQQQFLFSHQPSVSELSMERTSIRSTIIHSIPHAGEREGAPKNAR
jgi:hypothetical protein